jgi:UDP-N-acetylglucosamine 2-epimerase (non-hydrolysing)
MLVAFVVGTRPDIIKTWSVLREIECVGWQPRLVHTGQHYDHQMSRIFFQDLQIREPDVFLEVGSGSHGSQTGQALARMEEAFLKMRPDLVVVQGDTNSTVAGALAAIKLAIPVAHLEAGVRSNDWTMPEEINRRLVDSVATFCLAPTPRAAVNLRREGRGDATHVVGDTLVEAAHSVLARLPAEPPALRDLQLDPGTYALVTVHRSENVDSPERLAAIVEILESIGAPVVLPLHPRGRKMLQQFGLLKRVEQCTRLLTPLGYPDFLALLRDAGVMLTDSGGVQQESSIVGVPCVTLRNNTEWIETVEIGHNRLVGVDPSTVTPVVRSILSSQQTRATMMQAPSPFQPGAARRFVEIITTAQADGRLVLPSSDYLRDGLPDPIESGALSSALAGR